MIRAAEKVYIANKISFMTGWMMGRPVTETAEFIQIVETAKEAGDSYYLVSVPRDETGMNMIRDFAKDVMSSFR